ncbi:MAG TPA: STAS/SEC14 domain-containing protein [Polyangiaceae bacterium]|nr:STAS/SEC14 domain-containing protein [Polyangiaceae bacterium]
MLDELIGRHRIRLEPPDLCFVTNDGDISVEDATAIMSRIRDFAGGKRRVFLLFDGTRSGNMAPEARKAVVDTVGKLPIGGIAIFGATFTNRVVATLILKAIGIIYPAAPAANFFLSEAEARAWLSERRSSAEA